MEIRSATIPADPPQNGTALTIGAYDGVHLGHRQVISEVRRLATERGLASAVVTFDRHPASVVRPESAPLLLTDTDQKLEQLATTGVDLTLIVPFDESRAGESAEDFVEEVLVRDLGARVVVVGEDFHFGHHRLGNVDLLRRMGASHGFEVLGIGLVGTGGSPARDHEQVSSTFIRRALARGDLKRANSMLGRAYEIRGVADPIDVVTCGTGSWEVFVNSAILVPAHGYYACWLEDEGGFRIGTTVLIEPTVDGSGSGGATVTAHPIDAHSDLSEGPVRLSFVSFLGSLLPGEFSGGSSERLGDIASSAREALG